MTRFGNLSVALSFKPLRKDHPLALLEEACLPLRAPRYATCGACASVCPVQAMHIEETAFQLDESCVRCARCVAACPMGALDLPGFAVPDLSREMSEPLRVDCWKVPGKLSPDEALRVPCLGGLSPGRLLELAGAAGSRPVELLDRGWCSTCSAGSKAEHPVATSLNLARALLESAGFDADRLLRLRRLSLPVDLMPAEIPDSDSETKMSRRHFFSALAAKTTVTIDRVKPLAPEPELRRRRGFEMEPVPSLERQRVLRSMERIGQLTWLASSPGLFYRVEVSAGCNNNQLCASICPTGALAVSEEGGRCELMFDTHLCIGCNECAVICPSGALRLLQDGYKRGGELLPDHPIRLTSFGQKICLECGQSFADQSAEELCVQCAKRCQLASSAFQTLFGSGR